MTAYLHWQLLGWLLLASAPNFWDAKPAAQWTPEEARTLLRESPWAQQVEAGRHSIAPSVPVYLASAAPIVLAEDILRTSRKSAGDDPAWTDYREYLTENAGKYIVIAIGVLDARQFLDNSETRHMEEESRLRIGKRKYKVVGHFPPSTSDPFARLVFPREVQAGDRSLTFELYVPGAGSPYREAEFPLKEMLYHGEPSY